MSNTSRAIQEAKPGDHFYIEGDHRANRKYRKFAEIALPFLRELAWQDSFKHLPTEVIDDVIAQGEELLRGDYR